jgi:hypothetical protein
LEVVDVVALLPVVSVAAVDELEVVADEPDVVVDELVAVEATPSLDVVTPGGSLEVVLPVDFFAVLLEPHEASPTVETASSTSMHATRPMRLKRLPVILILPSLPPGEFPASFRGHLVSRDRPSCRHGRTERTIRS